MRQPSAHQPFGINVLYMESHPMQLLTWSYDAQYTTHIVEIQRLSTATWRQRDQITFPFRGDEIEFSYIAQGMSFYQGW
jgi:hypothetical protein